MKNVSKLSRRGFLAASVAALTVRAVPKAATSVPGRRVLTLVYDKGLGMMRAVDKLVP